MLLIIFTVLRQLVAKPFMMHQIYQLTMYTWAMLLLDSKPSSPIKIGLCVGLVGLDTCSHQPRLRSVASELA